MGPGNRNGCLGTLARGPRLEFSGPRVVEPFGRPVQLGAVQLDQMELNQPGPQPIGGMPTAAVCRRGHVLSWFLYQTKAPPFCPHCGEPILTQCPACNSILPAESSMADWVPYWRHCAHCGKAYPWTAAGVGPLFGELGKCHTEIGGHRGPFRLVVSSQKQPSPKPTMAATYSSGTPSPRTPRPGTRSLSITRTRSPRMSWVPPCNASWMPKRSTGHGSQSKCIIEFAISE